MKCGMKTCLLVMGGKVKSLAALGQAVEEADHVLAADGGVRHLLALGQIPEGIMGDMDSIAPDQLKQLQEAGCQIHTCSPEKDDTDGSLIIKAALSMGYQKLEIWGALGGRMDHTFANIMLLLLPEIGQVAQAGQMANPSVVIRDQGLAIFLPSHGQQLQGQPGDIVSLFALGEPVTGFRNQGLKYQPPGDCYQMNFPLGISNEMLGTTACLDWEQGTLLCMQLDKKLWA